MHFISRAETNTKETRGSERDIKLPIRIVRHGGPRVSSYLQPILFVRRRRRVDKNKSKLYL
jgi:hypothetical protein